MTQTGALRAWYTLLVIFLSALAVSSVGLIYTAHQQRVADRRWCALLSTLDAPDAPPPTTERGLEVQRELRALRHDFGCKERP